MHTPFILFNSTLTLRALVSGSFHPITEAVPNKSTIVSVVALYTLVPQTFTARADVAQTRLASNLDCKLWEILQIDHCITIWTGTVNHLTV